jgi:glycosyltransferase involved in cell wall biosynthesis
LIVSVSLLDPRLRRRPHCEPVAPLRICIVASASLPIPPFDGYGGTQRGIHDLIEVLRRRGHHVTLCGPGDSLTEADERVTPLARSLWSEDSPYPLAERDGLAALHAREVGAALAHQSFDVINVRYDHYGLVAELVRQDRAPIVYSLHNVASEKTLPIVERFADRIAINAHCGAHRAQYPRARAIDVVYYGMDVHAFPFGDAPLSAACEEPTLPLLRRLRGEGRDYLVSVGRIAVEKGQGSAIAIARRAGMPLVIVGEPFARDTDGPRYLRQHVLPQVDGRDVLLFGRANEVEKRELLRYAKGLLFTTGLERPDWKEPFGRVLMEALATGTPVVAHAHGSAPEVVGPAVGFLCRDVADMAAAAARLGTIDRRTCRRYAERRLSRERMGGDYERLFRDVVHAWRVGRAPCAPRLAAVG